MGIISLDANLRDDWRRSCLNGNIVKLCFFFLIFLGLVFHGTGFAGSIRRRTHFVVSWSRSLPSGFFSHSTACFTTKLCKVPMTRWCFHFNSYAILGSQYMVAGCCWWTSAWFLGKQSHSMRATWSHDRKDFQLRIMCDFSFLQKLFGPGFLGVVWEGGRLK